MCKAENMCGCKHVRCECARWMCEGARCISMSILAAWVMCVSEL